MTNIYYNIAATMLLQEFVIIKISRDDCDSRVSYNCKHIQHDALLQNNNNSLNYHTLLSA